MKKIIVFINSCLFSVISFLTTVPLSFLFMILWLIPFVPEKRYKFDFISSYWGALMLWFLKILTGIRPNIVGYDQLKKGKSYLIIGKHESTWETLIMHTFMRPAPIFILKKELAWVPFIGWCLASANNIPIDRKAGISAMKKIIKEGKKYIQRGHNIIIFPQGTRVSPTASTKDYPYKTGFIGLIKELKIDVVPMALNSGNLWRKKEFLKKKCVITMEFLKPIPFEKIKDLTKEELAKKLEAIIEKKSKELSFEN
jgi:1-acyl-sn-glycerol-3-phosphate acyltransferase